MVANTAKNSITPNRFLIAIIGLLLLFIGYLIFVVNPTRVMEIVSPGTLVLRQVRDLSELTTAVFDMETVVPAKNNNLIAESKLLYIAHGSVRVGVNLKDFNSDSVVVDQEQHQITVTLPPLKVLDRKIDVEHSSVYSYDKGLLALGPDVIPLVPQAQQEALNRIEKSVCQEWLIQTANERVQKIVEQILHQVLKNTEYREIIVNTQPFAESSCTMSQAL